MRFDDAELAQALGLQRAGADPGRGRPDHQLAARAGRGPGRAAARDRRRGGEHPWSSRRRRTGCWRLDWRDVLAAGRGAGADRRGGGVLGAAQAAAAAPAGRDARGGVGAQRPARGAGGDAAERDGPARRRARADRRDRGLRAGRRRRDRAARGLAGAGSRCAGWRCPPPACTRSRCWRSSSRATARRRSPTPAGSSPSTWPRWCWATCGCRTGPATRGFAEGVAWLAQIGLFVMLGLLASPARLPAAVLPALVVRVRAGARRQAIAVIVSTLPLRVPWRQEAFLSWAGLRGAVPIVLATIPISARLPGATKLFDLVFVVVVVFTLLQGPTLPWVARRLKVTHRRNRGRSTSRPRRWRPSPPTCSRHRSRRAPGCTAWRSSSCGCPPRRTWP